MCLIYGVLSHLMVLKSVLWRFTLFCRNFSLSQFTRFCVEKKCVKNCVCGEKKANIRGALDMHV